MELTDGTSPQCQNTKGVITCKSQNKIRTNFKNSQFFTHNGCIP